MLRAIQMLNQRETERTHVDTVAKDLYNKSEVTEAEKVKLKKYYQKIFQIYLMKKLKIALSEALKETNNKENAQPRATFRSVKNARTTNVNYSKNKD